MYHGARMRYDAPSTAQRVRGRSMMFTPATASVMLPLNVPAAQWQRDGATQKWRVNGDACSYLYGSVIQRATSRICERVEAMSRAILMFEASTSARPRAEPRSEQHRAAMRLREAPGTTVSRSSGVAEVRRVKSLPFAAADVVAPRRNNATSRRRFHSKTRRVRMPCLFTPHLSLCASRVRFMPRLRRCHAAVPWFVSIAVIRARRRAVLMVRLECGANNNNWPGSTWGLR